MTIEPIGKRIASYRKARGFKTAASLAEAIPNDAISTAVIQNIESGRKADITVAQLLDISFALRVTPAHLIAPVNRQMDKFAYPGVGSDVADLDINTAFAWMTARLTGRGLTNNTESYMRTITHHTDVLRAAIDEFKFAAAAADKQEPVEEFVNEDPDSGQTWTQIHDPNEANFQSAVYYAGLGERSYRWLEQVPRYDLSWATRPWADTKYMDTPTPPPGDLSDGSARG